MIDRGQLEKALSSPALPLTLEPYNTLYMSSFHDGSEIARNLSRFYVDFVRSTGHDVRISGESFGHF